MTSQIVLDLKGIPSPISLLKFKSRLKGMAKGEVLEIFSHDFDLAQDVVQEAFFCAYRDLTKLKEPERFGG